jgi:hypothetical protein
MTATAPVATEFRKVLGHFCTGVTVITGAGPVGFACQAFAALSLDPPLVLFCPGKASRTWQAIARTSASCPPSSAGRARTRSPPPPGSPLPATVRPSWTAC